MNTVSACGPVGLVYGGDERMYFSTPDDGCVNGNSSGLGSVLANGTGGLSSQTGRGKMFDLEVVQRQAVRAGLRQ